MEKCYASSLLFFIHDFFLVSVGSSIRFSIFNMNHFVYTDLILSSLVSLILSLLPSWLSVFCFVRKVLSVFSDICFLLPPPQKKMSCSTKHSKLFSIDLKDVDIFSDVILCLKCVVYIFSKIKLKIDNK